jgi:leucyl/phenylalanyl-tRNA--protein transferase
VHGGFSLLDTQFVTEHLRQFGTVEVDRDKVQKLLERALDGAGDFRRLAPDASGDIALGILARANGPGR